MHPRAEDLWHMNRRQLTEALCKGCPIDPAALDDTEYLGVSLGLPAPVVKLTWLKFKKVFHRDPQTGRLRGWNVRLVQNGLEADHQPMRLRDGSPKTFGHYRVAQASSYKLPVPCAQGLMLDYGLGGNHPLDPTSRMRDPLVAIAEGDVSLLLGWSYLDLGPFRLGTPSFFTLQRDCPLSHRADPPHPEG